MVDFIIFVPFCTLSGLSATKKNKNPPIPIIKPAIIGTRGTPPLTGVGIKRKSIIFLNKTKI